MYRSIVYTINNLDDSESLTLQSGSKQVQQKGSGTYTAPQFVASGASYLIQIAEQPKKKTCRISGQFRGVAGDSSINVEITCGGRLSGTVSGLVVGGELTVSNGTETIVITQSGPFAYTNILPVASVFSLTIVNSKTKQACTVSPSTGIVKANVDNIRITCTDLWTLEWYLGSGTYGFTDGEFPDFAAPWAIVRSSSGDLYISELANRIRKVSKGVTTTIAGSQTGAYGFKNGPGKQALFNNPTGLALDDDTGILYVADSRNYCIRRLLPQSDGTYNVETYAGDCAWAASEARDQIYGGRTFTNGEILFERKLTAWRLNSAFEYPGALLLDKEKNLWIGESVFNTRTSTPGIRRISRDGLTTFEGGYCGGDWGTESCSLAFDSADNLYISDPGVNVIHIIRTATLTPSWAEIAGSLSWGFADGLGTEALFRTPEGIVHGANGNFYIADHNNNRIRELTPDGMVTTVLGSGAGAYAPGSGVFASIYQPSAIVVESAKSMIVVSYGTNAILRMRKN